MYESEIIVITTKMQRMDYLGICYKKLWKLLIDRDMKKKDLIAKSGISQSSVTKLGHNESVSTDIIVKICTALECDLTDIMELVPEEK